MGNLLSKRKLLKNMISANSKHFKVQDDLTSVVSLWRIEFLTKQYRNEIHFVDFIHSAIKPRDSRCKMSLFVCVEVLRPSKPNGVMLNAVSLPNHTFTGQA